jgi:hypothetical protein
MTEEQKPESMTREEWEKLKQRQKEVQGENVKSISVEIDPKSLATPEMKEKAENWDKILEKAKRQILEKSIKLGVEWDTSDIETEEDIRTALASLKEIEDSRRPSPSGSAPLEGQKNYYGSSLRQKEYSTYEDMIEDVKARAERGEEEAKEILKQFEIKVAKGIKEAHGTEYEYPSIKQLLKEKQRKKLKKQYPQLEAYLENKENE